jgi:hypothetical protein
MAGSQTLTPTQLVADGPGLNLTTLLTAATGTTVAFNNSGREVFLVLLASASATVTVDFGTLVLGEAVSNFNSVSLVATNLFAFGPFHTLLDQPGGNLINVTLSTVTNVTVALVQTTSVY